MKKNGTLFMLTVMIWMGCLGLKAQQGLLDPNLISLAPNIAQKCSPSLIQDLTLGKNDQRYIVLVEDPGLFSSRWADQESHLRIIGVNDIYHLLILELPGGDLLEKLISDPGVLFIDHANKTIREEIVIKDFDRSLNTINLAQAYFPFLDGLGQQVSVKESLFDPNDIDIQAQILGPLRNDQITTHTTTVATIIVGRGNLAKESRGLAPEAGLSSSSFLNLLPDAPGYFDEENISVQNHSYGIDIESFYGAEAMAYDMFSAIRPNVLHVFSAGNEGQASPSTGIYKDLAGWANLTGNMKMAKNVLVVGAIDSFGVSSDLASRGPGYDGRIKPELVTMGQRGSSESAAVASGAALLLQQAYQSRHAAQLAPSTLLKVIMINSADDVGADGIDFVTGYGSLNLYQSINTILENRYMQGQISAGEIMNLDLSVPENATQIKITLGWNDPSAMPNAPAALVNDLDLTLMNNDQRWYPWVLNHFPHPDSLRQPALRKEDHLNNIEQISVSDPAAGTYTISVKPNRITSGRQIFFISYQIDTAETFYWTSPSPQETLASGSQILTRWNQNLDHQNGWLEYSIDSGLNWILIDSHIDLQKNYYQWNIPEVFSEVQLRMISGENIFPSDVFIISEKTELRVGYECEEELLLNWQPVREAIEYDIFQYNGRDMEFISTQQDTQLVIDKNEYPSEYFAVRPVNDRGLSGYRSDAINYTNQGSFCYLVGFFSRLEGDRAILDLNISSSFAVEKIWIEKEVSNQFMLISQTSDINSLKLQFNDTQLVQGLNTYRATILLKDGTQIISETTSIIYAGNRPVLVFPNPALLDSEITFLLQKPASGSIIIYDALGVKIRRFNIVDGNSRIPLEGMTPGVYYFFIEQNEQLITQGNFSIL